MLGVFIYLFSLRVISHIQVFLQAGRLLILSLLSFCTCTVVGVGLGCISYSWPLNNFFLQVSTGVIAVYILISGLVLCH